MLPGSEAVKTKVDVVAGSSIFLGYFKAIPWPEISACLGAIYMALRIGEWIWSKLKKKSEADPS